ncbi:MAG: type secretion ATPase, ClpV1 family, partial [Bryobacterales bacterium]|nr:type secretion ATPase, ClpV1 family [Bryobacterales bacterium]
MSLNLKSLIGKMNHTTRSGLEAAAGLCLARTNYDVEVEHFLMKLLESESSDFALILQHYGVDRSRLMTELQRSLDRLKSGNARTPAFSPTVLKMLTEAWMLATIDYDASEIRSGFALLALLGNSELARLVHDISKELQLIPAEALS